MKNKKTWINLSILSLCTVAFLGMTLRSKMLFSLPFIDFNNLSNAHSHFAFGGWVTMALMVLMISGLLPASLHNKSIYQWLSGGIILSSWCLLITFYVAGNGSLSDSFSSLFILITYIFSWIFIKDIWKAGVSKTVLLLSVSSLICLVLSSAGPIALAYLFSIKSLNAILYRDSLFTYLHLQYNGFFALAVFALLFHAIESKIPAKAMKSIHRFSILLCSSIIPSLFLSYLWQDPDNLLRVIALSGSILVFLTFIWFIISLVTLKNIYITTAPIIRFSGVLSMSAFALKLFLQGFTIFPSVGNAVFGARPMIIGFLHLVFLGFVTLFLLAYFAQKGFLDIKSKFTRIALVVFATGVVLNEAILMSEGLASMFIKSSPLFPWLLWITSIWLFTGTLLVAVSRIKMPSLKTID